MHLDPAFGLTVREVRAAGYPIAAEVPCTPASDSASDMAAAIGVATVGMAPVIAHERPDWLLLLGDRGEQLAAAIVAMHLPIPIAHIAGGDRTLGAVDDTIRDMITRAAHLHFVTSAEAATRLRALGEREWRIRLVGSPGLDDLPALAAADPGPVRDRYGLPATGPYLLILQHAETRANRDPAADMEATLAATAAVGLPRVAILPNADAGGRAMAARLKAADNVRVFASVPRADFAVLLAHAAVLVGNSSAGFTEAPLLRVPAVNVGRRQAGRVRGDNLIDVEPRSAEIEAAVRRALDPSVRRHLSGRSPHGDGGAARRIVEALAEPIHGRLLDKFDD
jgi:UDP-hydrolysing UDP-N-acetyl-D-glucosamine 2-epimerase